MDRAGADGGDTVTALRARLQTPLLLWSGFLLVFAATAGYWRQSVDVVATYLPAWHLARSGNLHLDSVVAQAQNPWLMQVGPHWVSDRFPGAILAQLPLYLISGNAAAKWPAAVTAAAVSAAAVAVLFVVFSRLVARRTAVMATLVAATCTSTWSVSADQIWTHGPGQLVLLAAVLTAASGGWWLAGLCFSAAVMIRPHLGTAAVVLGLYLGLVRRQLRVPLRIALATLPGVFGLLLYNRLVFGSWSVLGGYATVNHGQPAFAAHWYGVGPLDFLENIVGTAFSPGRGIFLYSPFLLILLPGLRAGWRGAPDWVKGSALAGAAYLLVQLYLNRFSGGAYFYGYRLPIESLTLAAPLLLRSYTHWVRTSTARRRVFNSLVLTSFVIEFLGALPLARFINSQHPWTSSDLGHVLYTLGPAGSVVMISLALLIAFVTTWIHHRLTRREAVTALPPRSGRLRQAAAP